MTYKNYIYLFHACFFIFILSLAGCADEQEDEDTWGIEFSYKKSPGDEDIWHIGKEETINAVLGDTLILYVNCKGGKLLGIHADNALEITDRGNGEYSILIVKSGEGLSFFAIMNPDHLDENIQKDSWFFIDASIYEAETQSYYVKSSYVIVEPDDTGLEKIIMAELEQNKLILPTDSRYNLDISTSIYEGKLTHTPVNGEPDYGTYTSTNIFAMKDVAFHYNDFTYDFTMDGYMHVTGYFSVTTFKQDLTSLFRDKYPSVTGVFVKTSMFTYDQ
ncbi:MAG: hypothetical protein VB074_10065 [Proteiniphilum sp.]|uniref:hypothetical protein n=1 Tax=Proteiniphilum sp. TaxID=1926877 RepID=UPI002B20D1F3|nr:hypothetical protein [Proteiniphilum sp.]MEA5128520.1 hypothetical protein [Proteiniphilum sp.]